MAFNFLERLGVTLGQSVAERVLGTTHPAEAPAPEAESPPAEAAVAEAPVAEAPPVEAAPVEAAPVEAAVSEPVAETWTAPEPAPAADVAYAPAVDVATTTAPEPAPAEASAPTSTETISVDAFGVTSTAPATAPEAEAVTTPVSETVSEPVAEAHAVPEKSAEELEEEQLWGELDGAWGRQDFERVTQILDRLRELQPENNAIIDEKIAAAQYNQAAAFEQAGDLNRALYLYQEAQRRNPALGEATFAIERVQAALQPPPAEAAPEPEPAPPAEQSYTVESGDSLSAIAERFYGDANQWQRIFEANTDQISDPNLIYPGQVLRIPA